jgi:threonine dehydrogenase-like Zn-dependent dehydrogenase
MKAIVLSALGQVDLLDVPVPQIQDDELLIQTGAATICTSDLNDIRENPFGMTLPVGMGHEASGTVVRIGPAVRGFQVGDRVATHPVHPCGKCQACREGLRHLCLNWKHLGVNMPGTFAEYYVVRQDRARHIPGDLDFAVAALAEPVSVCLEALAQARLAPGNNLLVIGDGPFGVLMTRQCKNLALDVIVIAGFFDQRLAYARHALQVNTWDTPDAVQAMRAPLGGAGYDAVILAVSSRKAFVDGLQCLKPRGRLVVFSALPGNTPVDLLWVHLKELEIIGACSDQERFDEAVIMLSDPSLGLAEMITHRFKLEEYRQALQQADAGKEQAMKVAFVL